MWEGVCGKMGRLNFLIMRVGGHFQLGATLTTNLTADNYRLCFPAHLQ